MDRFRRILLCAALLTMAALAVLCVFSAFLGAVRAKALFNSAPLAGLWFLLVVLLGLGLFGFKRPSHSPGLLALHVGALLILVGALWGSEDGHGLAARLTGCQKIPTGYMRIREGQASSTVVDETGRELGRLPFSVMLRDFRVELYEPTGPVKDYVSELAVLEEGKVVAEKAIEVNKPLHYGGYHFYQHSYDMRNLKYTILSLTSDSGLRVVSAGFLLLVAGAFWWCWIAPVVTYLRKRS